MVAFLAPPKLFQDDFAECHKENWVRTLTPNPLKGLVVSLSAVHNTHSWYYPCIHVQPYVLVLKCLWDLCAHIGWDQRRQTLCYFLYHGARINFNTNDEDKFYALLPLQLGSAMTQHSRFKIKFLEYWAYQFISVSIL